MRPHFVTVGQHTINVAAISYLEDKLDRDGDDDPGTMMLHVHVGPYGVAWLTGAEREALLAYLAEPPPTFPAAPGDMREWTWMVRP